MWVVELATREGQADPSPLGLGCFLKEQEFAPPASAFHLQRRFPHREENCPRPRSTLPCLGRAALLTMGPAWPPPLSPLPWPLQVCRFSQDPSSGATWSLVGRK